MLRYIFNIGIYQLILNTLSDQGCVSYKDKVLSVSKVRGLIGKLEITQERFNKYMIFSQRLEH
jgi:hypothetical protein